MEVIITGITGTYLATMAVIDRRRKEIPVMPGIFCLVVLALAQIVNGKGWIHWVPGLLIGLFVYLVS